jgi:hypothetical protein
MSDRFPAPLDKDWTPLPRALLRHAGVLGLDDRDRRVILVLEGYRWRLGELVQMGQRQLGIEAHVTRRTLQRVTARLHNKGLVLKSQRGAESGRGRGRTLYDLDPLWRRLAELEAGICAPPMAGDQITGHLGAKSGHLGAKSEHLGATQGAPRPDVPDISDPPPSSAAVSVAHARGDAPGTPPPDDDAELEITASQQRQQTSEEEEAGDGGGGDASEGDGLVTPEQFLELGKAIARAAGRGPMRRLDPTTALGQSSETNHPGREARKEQDG